MRIWTSLGGRRRWQKKYAYLSIENGTICVYADYEAFRDGDVDEELMVKISPSYRLAPLKVDTSPAIDAVTVNERIFYRSLMDPAPRRDAAPRVPAGGNSAVIVYEGGGTRIFRWGVGEARELGVWSTGIRAAMGSVTAREAVEGAAADAVASAEGLNAARLLQDAVRVGTAGETDNDVGSSAVDEVSADNTLMRVLLDDGTPLPTAVTSSLSAAASAADVCIAIAAFLVLGADADFSLFLALPPAPAPMPPGPWPSAVLVGLSDYTRAPLAVCVPDAMSVEALIRAAAASGANIVFRRRYAHPVGLRPATNRDGDGEIDDPLASAAVDSARAMADPAQTSVEESWSQHRATPKSSLAVASPRGKGDETAAWLSSSVSVRRGAVAWGALAPHADADAEAAAATGPAAAALRLAFLSARSDIVSGRLAITLQEALGAAGLVLVVEQGRVGAVLPSSTSPRSNFPPPPPSTFYRARLWGFLSPQAVAQAEAVDKVTSSDSAHAAHAGRVIDALADRLRAAHSAASSGHEPFGAMRALVGFASAQPGFGSQWFVALLVRRAIHDPAGGRASPSASRTPPWAKLPTHGAHPHEPQPVIVAVGANGILMRPAPPMSPDTFEQAASAPRNTPARKALATALEGVRRRQP